jgi:NAD(P)-dependent dehydrogenase (short-subunit alcohol dehydrogenase family)
VIDGILSQMPLKRMGETIDMVDALKFLLSDEARWITGHVLNVDGGQIMRV